MLLRIILFLILNFGALAIGGYFTGKGVPSDWYASLNKAPWTPPGWVFGFSWTTIMICFAIYMAYLIPEAENRKFVIGLFIVQWILNVAWNPIFFYYHKVGAALVVILLLTAVITYFLIKFWPILRIKSVLIMFYFIWLLIASSLNAFILLKN